MLFNGAPAVTGPGRRSRILRARATMTAVKRISRTLDSGLLQVCHPTELRDQLFQIGRIDLKRDEDTQEGFKSGICPISTRYAPLQTPVR